MGLNIIRSLAVVATVLLSWSGSAQAETGLVPEWASAYKPHVVLNLAHATLKTNADYEVDKKGMIYGLGLGGNHHFGSTTARARLGVLTSKLKGSGTYIKGDQTAQVTTPYLDLAAGYRIMDTFALYLGVQHWFAKGSNFAPDEDAQKNQLHWYLEFNSKIPQVEGLSAALSYMRGFKTAERKVSIIGVGVGYDL